MAEGGLSMGLRRDNDVHLTVKRALLALTWRN